MKRKFKFILAIGFCITLLLAGVACTKPSMLEEYQQNGYKIMVTYDPNGGSFLSNSGITLVDMFNPSDYTKDSNGQVHIKLTEPTDPNRPNSGAGNITLTMPNHFFAGWYTSRELVTVNGVPVDKDGNELTHNGTTYVYKNGKRGEFFEYKQGPVDKAGQLLEQLRLLYMF